MLLQRFEECHKTHLDTTHVQLRKIGTLLRILTQALVDKVDELSAEEILRQSWRWLVDNVVEQIEDRHRFRHFFCSICKRETK